MPIRCMARLYQDRRADGTAAQLRSLMLQQFEYPFVLSAARL